MEKLQRDRREAWYRIIMKLCTNNDALRAPEQKLRQIDSDESDRRRRHQTLSKKLYVQVLSNVT
jgi:hypothetical protein